MGRFAGLVLAAAAASTYASAASAGELRWTHFGVRPLAMGNAYVAVADDFNALFYNPAGLARLKEWDGELINPMLEVSANTVSGASDILDLVNTNSSDVTPVLNLLESYAGKPQHFALGLTPHLVIPTASGMGFGFGVGIDLSATLAFHRDISGDVKIGPDILVPFSMAISFLENRLSFGGSLKVAMKGGVDREFSINDIQAFTSQAKASENAAGTESAASADTGPKLDDYIEGGVGVGVDGGILFTPIKTMSPTLGVSITDFGGTPYKKFDINGEALAAPKARLPSVNTGVSLKPWESGSQYVRASVDAHAINQPVHYSKKFNVGAEWGYGTIIKVQTGLHQGELTGGFEFDVFLLSLRMVTYAEQLGTIAGQDENLRDRRYAMQLKLLI